MLKKRSVLLLMEVDVSIGKLVYSLLKKIYKVKIISSLKEVKDCNKFDACIADCRLIFNERFRDYCFPIIVLSEYPQSEDALWFLTRGCYDYIESHLDRINPKNILGITKRSIELHDVYRSNNLPYGHLD